MAINSRHFEKKMESFPFSIFLNFLLAILIFFMAEAGRMAGIKEQPLAISVIWPPTGFALAALLLFGFRAWPGVFLGNFIYNYFSLITQTSIVPDSTLIPFLTAVVVSSGSLFQATIGNIILRSFSSEKYFKTVSDVVIFLFFGGILTCLIASSIGVTALYNFYGNMTINGLIQMWVTFWVGDTMGVFIFTPLLVVWTLQGDKAFVLVSYFWEFLLILLSFAVLTFFIYVTKLPLIHLYIPICMWAAYRFRMHGATLSILLITLVVILPLAYGMGPFKEEDIYPHRLKFLVSFLEIMVGVSLTFAAVVEERDTLSLLEEVKRFDVNDLLHRCAMNAIEHNNKKNFSIKLIESYDEKIEEIVGWPEDLYHAFQLIFNYSIDSLNKQFEEKKMSGLLPFLKITTKDELERVIIEVEHNGDGLSEFEIKHVFSSTERDQDFILSSNLLNLRICRDIILYIYRGELKIESKLKFSVYLPKEVVKK